MDRRAILAALIRDRFDGSQAKFARAIKRSPSLVNQWLTGKTAIGDAVSRHIEITLGLGLGYFDGRPMPAPVEPGQDFVPIERVQLKLQAGITGFTVEHMDGNGPPIFFRRDFIESKGWRPDKLYALKVAGDSMEPALYDGDLVVINTADTTPRDGEVFAVNYEGQLVIKRLRRDAGLWWLDSDNPRYKPKLCDEHAIIIGRVVYKQSERI